MADLMVGERVVKKAASTAGSWVQLLAVLMALLLAEWTASTTARMWARRRAGKRVAESAGSKAIATADHWAVSTASTMANCWDVMMGRLMVSWECLMAAGTAAMWEQLQVVCWGNLKAATLESLGD